ncbi:uncharacterized protein LOC116241017, partial [Phasianus colchicus]|uniref:uncharacterized protein LOC116241017 n=1 Tax=Phasianus colchicus TaxID=9054 RepID=UPI00129D4F0D
TRYPRICARHSQPRVSPSDAGAGRSPSGEELAAAAAGRRCHGRSRAEGGGGSAARRGAVGERRSGEMRQCRAAGLAAVLLAVAVSRAQVQQEPAAETTEDTGINITCSHPSIQSEKYIHWYRQLQGRGPAFLVSAVKGSKEVPDPEGQVSVSADRRSSALWLARPRLGDAAVYYCAVDPREAKPGLRPGTNRFGRGGGTVPSGPEGGAACMAAKLHPDQGAPP